MDKLQAYLKELYKPFHPSQVEWKPGKVTNSGDKAQAQAYADLRAYQNRLDEVCGADWAVSYTPWGDRLICNLTICGVTRSSTGEPSSDSERWEIAGTASEAQAFKRACAMFGLGRYLYNLPDVWAEFDPQRKRFTEQGAAKLNAILMAHYKRATEETPKNGPASVSTSQQTAPAPQSAQTPDISPQDAPPAQPVAPDTLAALHRLGGQVYGAEWDKKRPELVAHVTKGATTESKDLTENEARKLIAGMQAKRAQSEQPDSRRRAA